MARLQVLLEALYFSLVAKRLHPDEDDTLVECPAVTPVNERVPRVRPPHGFALFLAKEEARKVKRLHRMLRVSTSHPSPHISAPPSPSTAPLTPGPSYRASWYTCSSCWWHCSPTMGTLRATGMPSACRMPSNKSWIAMPFWLLPGRELLAPYPRTPGQYRQGYVVLEGPLMLLGATNRCCMFLAGPRTSGPGCPRYCFPSYTATRAAQSWGPRACGKCDFRKVSWGLGSLGLVSASSLSLGG